MSYFVIGDDDTVLGFRLAGVAGTVAGDREEVLVSLRSCLEDPSVRIILVTERLAQLVREEIDRIIQTMDFPLVVELPDGKGPLPGRLSLKEHVKAAVGISV